MLSPLSPPTPMSVLSHQAYAHPFLSARLGGLALPHAAQFPGSRDAGQCQRVGSIAHLLLRHGRTMGSMRTVSPSLCTAAASLHRAIVCSCRSGRGVWGAPVWVWFFDVLVALGNNSN